MLSSDDEVAFQEAVRLRDQRGFHEALRIIDTLIQRYPLHAELWLFKGHLHKEAQAYPDAVTAFFEAVTLSPTFELASLGLFHSLWKAGLQMEALEEARRYLSVADSTEYRQLLQELNEVG